MPNETNDIIIRLEQLEKLKQLEKLYTDNEESLIKEILDYRLEEDDTYIE